MRAHAVTRRRPLDRFEEERARLRPVPELALDLSITRAVKTTSQSLVHFDSNTYSVPFVFASKMLTLKASTHEVAVFDGARPVAKHARSYEVGRVVENPAHYAGLLDAKKAAGTAKLTDRFLALGRSERDRQALQALLKAMLEGELSVHRHLAKIMVLAELYGRTEVLGAVHRAAAAGLVGANYLQNLIAQGRAARGEPDPAALAIPAKPEWEQLTLPECDLAGYDVIFEEPDAKTL